MIIGYLDPWGHKRNAKRGACQKGPLGAIGICGHYTVKFWESPSRSFWSTPGRSELRFGSTL